MKVFWKNIICLDGSFLKYVFIIWVVMWGKLRIKDVVIKWNGSIDLKCVLLFFVRRVMKV